MTRLLRPRWDKSLSRLSVLGTFLLVSGISGCAGKPPVTPVAAAETSNGPAKVVKPDEFAQRAHHLLLSKDRSEAMKLEMAGVVQYQLSRARELFRDGHTRHAEDVVTGALLLLRHDDELLSATRGQEEALFAAAHAAAQAGDAGRAQALYELTLSVADDKKTKEDVTEHLSALEKWNASTDGETDLERVGEQARRALARSVVDSRANAYLSARDGIIRWMQEALMTPNIEGEELSRDDREIAIEAYRAVRTGAPAMIALNLRQGTPDAAINALERADLDRALPPGLRVLIESAAQKDDPSAWQEIFRQIENLRSQQGSETRLPRYVTDGAAFWAAISLYRSSPGVLEHAMPLGMTLVEFGMPEVASTLLAQNLDKSASDEAIDWSLNLVLRGLLELSQTDQLEAARRSYQEAQPLLDLGAQTRRRSQASSRAESLMGALEARHGHVQHALPLMESSLSRAPDAEGLLRLAQLQEQVGRREKALESVRSAILSAQKSRNLLLETRAEEALFRYHRDGGDKKLAAEALSRALARILILHKMETATVEVAMIERQLARILEYYGERLGVRAAYERALVASRNNAIELEITLTDMSRAALTWGDVKLGRLATQSALDLGLPAENLIYIALWQQLLEQRANVTSDGNSHEVLRRAGKASGWLGTLRELGLGEVAAKDLVATAHGIPEETEAMFYSALFSGAANTPDDKLRPIAGSAAVDLIEVRIAQDLIARDAKFSLPPQVELP